MRNIYLTAVPLQARFDLEQLNYGSTRPDGHGTPTRFPIVQVIRDTMAPGDEAQVIAIRQENKDTARNYAFLLEELDRSWKEHLRNMDALRDGIGLRGYGQKDPKLEYKREGFEMFQSMLFQIREGVFRALTRVHVQPAEPAPAEDAVEEGNAPAEAPQQEAPKAKPTLSLRHKENDDLAYSGSQTTDAGNQPAKAKPRVGRNDPCPCGSGKKYKKCCGMGKV